jgi:hypothetical protein
MTPVIALLLIATLSFLVIRVGATVLEHTGLSRDAARFQALSAFFGAGFTTVESELVVTHPVRRRVIRDLIIVGNIGVISLLTSGVATATTNPDESHPAARIGVIVGGLLALYLLSRSNIFMRLIDYSIDRTLVSAGMVNSMDYERVLRTHAGYGVTELAIEPNHPMAEKTLGESQPRAHGVTVLGVARSDGSYDGSPRGETLVRAGDTLLVYGSDNATRSLVESRRPSNRRSTTQE